MCFTATDFYCNTYRATYIAILRAGGFLLIENKLFKMGLVFSRHFKIEYLTRKNHNFKANYFGSS